MLYIEKFWNNDEFTAEVIQPNGKSIKGLIGSQLGFTVKHDWSSWSREGGNQLSDKAKAALAGVGSMTGGDIGKWIGDLAQASFRQIYQTVVFWKGSDVSGFNVTLVVVNWDGKHNPLKVFKELMDLVLPTREGFMLKPPHNYRVDVMLKSDSGGYTGGEGTLGFRYSNWFFAEQFFVVGNVTSKFSFEKCQDGSPLWGEFSIDLEPCMEVSKNTFLSWIRI